MAFRTNKTPVLQTKSASGAVASFNTALAMPLSSCNIAVNAWQEGSGDPSPVNIRPIHGWDKVNATRAGKNIANIKTYYDWVKIGAYAINQYCLPNNTLVIMSLVDKDPTIDLTGVFFGYITGNYNGSALQARDYYWVINNGSMGNRKTNISLSGSNLLNSLMFYPSNETTFNKIFSRYDIQIELGSTDTDFEQYTGNIYTIQLGQEVYGAEVDVVNSVAHVTHGYREFDGTENGWTWGSPYVSFYIPYMANSNFYQGLANWLKTIDSLYVAGIVFGSGGNKVIYITKYVMQELGITDIEGWKTYLSNHNLQIVYPLATPFDIQLTPTQIETLIGNNTIFADTGDIDLTYKDLDIAKRGNFREVFRLPS